MSGCTSGLGRVPAAVDDVQPIIVTSKHFKPTHADKPKSNSFRDLKLLFKMKSAFKNEDVELLLWNVQL
jgi:hypothetical protein